MTVLAATWLAALLEQPPDWEKIASAMPFAEAMAACPQDAVYHAEGDVWTHTRMVVEALHQDREYNALPEARRHVLTLAAVLHDIAKPRTTVHEWDDAEQRDRVRQPNHAKLGARMAWQALWQEGVPVAQRLSVYWLIAWHQRVFHLWTDANMLRQAIIYSLVGNWRDLLILARADNRGRWSPHVGDTEDTLSLLSLWLDEQGVLDRPWTFADPASTREFLEKSERSPHYTAQQPRGSKVIVLAGLPGVGKDTYARTAFPDHAVVSLDALRASMKVDPRDDQGAVIQAAFEQARQHLRVKRDFIWNATNITRTTREKIVGLARAYDAYVSIHVIERPLALILRQNRDRAASVPEAIIHGLIRKWEPPSILEAHEIVWV